MMTREEAIKVLENGGWWDLLIPVTTIEGRIEDDKLHEALDLALSSLRPVSREQVERMFPGCPFCKQDSEGYVRKFGAYSIQNGELATGHCKSQKIKFCPHCSRPLTDEAVEMVMERLEALKDG